MNEFAMVQAGVHIRAITPSRGAPPVSPGWQAWGRGYDPHDLRGRRPSFLTRCQSGRGHEKPPDRTLDCGIGAARPAPRLDLPFCDQAAVRKAIKDLARERHVTYRRALIRVARAAFIATRRPREACSGLHTLHRAPYARVLAPIEGMREPAHA